MRIGVVGINHKLADLKLREELAKACQKHFSPLSAIHSPHTFVLLSTCNRTEIYFSSHSLPKTHSYLLSVLRSEVKGDFDHKLYSFFGLDCFSHLAKVTLGLDSAIVAETEIQGQVKLAYEKTAQVHALPRELHFLFQKSLGIAKKIRTTLQLGRGMPHIEHAILQIGAEHFEAPRKARLLFVGASEINQKVLLFLKAKQFQEITLCNRSHLHALAFQKHHQIALLPWKALHLWHTFDWIILGTKSPHYLIHPASLPASALSDEKLVLDLSVPRNVDPEVGSHPLIRLFNIDQINQLLEFRHDQIATKLKEAEEMIAQATREHASRQALRRLPSLLAV